MVCMSSPIFSALVTGHYLYILRESVDYLTIQNVWYYSPLLSRHMMLVVRALAVFFYKTLLTLLSRSSLSLNFCSVSVCHGEESGRLL